MILLRGYDTYAAYATDHYAIRRYDSADTTLRHTPYGAPPMLMLCRHYRHLLPRCFI